jgi:hypothetical protein
VLDDALVKTDIKEGGGFQGNILQLTGFELARGCLEVGLELVERFGAWRVQDGLGVY